ncbi:MAG: HupE/UreJ family protein [Microcoleaceae cyanobacterium]
MIDKQEKAKSRLWEINGKNQLLVKGEILVCNATARMLRITTAIAIGVSLILLQTIKPATAHHPMGGQTPSNLWEGLLSGIGHPIIGIDHLAFVVAIGLIAAPATRGVLIPVCFIATAMLGTGFHLLIIDLPLVEMAIALSVVAFGVMLAVKQKLNIQLLAILAATAGIFHGYAYGEAIIGAEITPLLAYLIGFSAIQLLIVLLAMKFVELVNGHWQNQSFSLVRFFGLVISAIGAVFFTTALVS